MEAYERAAEGQERLSSYPYLFIFTEHEGQFYTSKDFSSFSIRTNRLDEVCVYIMFMS